MLPDVIGYKLEEGLNILNDLYSSSKEIIISQYDPPRSSIQVHEKRILKTYEQDGKIILVVSDF